MENFEYLNKKILLRFLKEKKLLYLLKNISYNDIFRVQTKRNIDTELFYHINYINNFQIKNDISLLEKTLYLNLEYFDFIINYLKINKIDYSSSYFIQQLTMYFYAHGANMLNSTRIIDLANYIVKKLN